MAAVLQPRAGPTATARAAFNHPRYGFALRVLAGYVVIVEGLVQLVFGRIDIPFVTIGFLEIGRLDSPVPRGIFVGGAVIGTLYALVGIGLILVYRANRVINFAQAQLGAVPAVLALLLMARKGWPYLAVLPLMLVVAVALGIVVETLFIRRFANAPRLILTVVTIGVGFILLVLEFFTKIWVSGELEIITTFPTPFASRDFTIGNAIFRGDHVVAVIVVAALVAALGAFFKYTDMGIAVRASAENGERASLLGIPVKRVSTVVWVLATVLSAVGVFLRAPLVGLPLTGFVGPSILLLGLAVAVIARMESLPTAFFAGMLIGIIDRAAVFSTRRASLANAVMLVVILVALLAQRGKLSRAHDTGASTWRAVKEFKPVPAELRDVAEVTWARLATAITVGLLVLGVPFILGDAKTSSATLVVIYAMVGVSLVILTGWAGQISLGQFAIAGIGAAVAGGLAANHGMDFFLSLILGGLAGALVAVLIGLPALRIQGLFLAVTTLAFAFTVESFVLRREWFAWLLPQDLKYVDRPVLYGRFDTTADSELFGVTIFADTKFYYLCVVFLALALAVARSIRRTRSGRLLIGTRENERMMQSFGVNLARTRLAAFAISGFIAAVAGGLFAYLQGSVTPEAFPPERSIQLFVMTVIGGLTSLPGAMLGAAFVLGLPLLPGLRDVELIEFITSGAGLILVLYFLPGGLAEGMYRIRDRFLRWVAARNQIHVPSLIADSLVLDTEAADTTVAAAEEHVLEAERLEHDPSVIACPACGALVPLSEARDHDHFTPVTTTSSGAVVANGQDHTHTNGNRLRRAKEGRR